MRMTLAVLSALLLSTLPGASQEAGKHVAKAKSVLATLTGEFEFPELKERVEVIRDRWGVPHILASEQDDLFFGQGFVAAQDRLFQIDMWRRLAVGELAEIIGKEAVEGDRFARLIKYRGDMDKEWRSYSPDTRAICTAFTRGINAYIRHAGDNLPIEYHILGIKPKPWQPEDVLGRMSGIIMTRNFQQEIARAQLVAELGVEKARLLSPTDPPRNYGPAKGLDLGGLDKKVLSGYQAAIKPLPFKPPQSESNNWVVSGRRTASGQPMLASDPHRPLMAPSLRYMVHLRAPGWDVIGAGEPALPGVALGHNQSIAWGITIVGTDQADLFVEETDPKNPTQYKFGNQWQPMKVVRETINVKGEAPVEVELRYTRHGPVIYQDEKRNRAVALKWVGSEAGGAAYLGSLAVGRAQNKQQFLEAVKAWHLPALNIVYADRSGTIGWIAAGRTPIRKKHDGLLPVPGGGAYDWEGYLEVKDLPQKFDPSEGYVATANHNILPPGYKHDVAFDWAPPYRYDVVKNRLDENKRFTLQDFKSIQNEVTSLPGKALIALIKAVELKDAQLQPYADLLAEWDGVLDVRSKAGPVYAAWLSELQDGFYARHVPKELLSVAKSMGSLPGMLKAIEYPDATWFGDNPKEARDQLVRSTFASAIEKLKKTPTGPGPLTWGSLHTATFRHPLSERDPAYAKLFNVGPFPRPGDANTPNNTKPNERYEQVHGATYRQLFDLADWDQGLAINAPGQSGQPGSEYYSNLAGRWLVGEYFPLVYSRFKIEEHAKHRLRLVPPKKKGAAE